VFERTDLRYRTTPALAIEELGLNVVFGGTSPSSRTMHLYIDGIAVGTQYLGPEETPRK